MTVTLDLPPELEAGLAAQAQARGITIDALIMEILASLASTPSSERSNAEIEKWQKEFDEWLDAIPDLPTLSDDAIGRKSIDSREDHW
jgi:hypothetical protein